MSRWIAITQVQGFGEFVSRADFDDVAGALKALFDAETADSLTRNRALVRAAKAVKRLPPLESPATPPEDKAA